MRIINKTDFKKYHFKKILCMYDISGFKEDHFYTLYFNDEEDLKEIHTVYFDEKGHIYIKIWNIRFEDNGDVYEDDNFLEYFELITESELRQRKIGKILE